MGKMMSVDHATDNGMLPPDGTKPPPNQFWLENIGIHQSAILQKMRDIRRENLSFRSNFLYIVMHLLGDNVFMCTVT